MENRCYCEISRSAIKHNIRVIQNYIPDTSNIMGIVKANGYGIGYEELAKALIEEGVHFLAVATLKEALELRECGIECDILILGHTAFKDIPLLKKYDLIQSVFSYEHAKMLHHDGIRTHIKLDTGMNRMGIVYQNHDKRMDEILRCVTLLQDKVEGIFTHFSVSDSDLEENLNFTNNQIDLFNEVVDILESKGIHLKYKHLANSYGIVNYPDCAKDFVRPGILLLGAHSNYECYQKSKLDFKPVLSWKCRVGLVKEVEKNTPVSYGKTFISDKKMKLATITCGYADGYPRELSNKGIVIINDVKCKIVGRICMDQMLVDVSGVEVKVDDEVILVGQSTSQCILMEDLASWCNTITNDLFCRISTRVERVYYD